MEQVHKKPLYASLNSAFLQHPPKMSVRHLKAQIQKLAIRYYRLLHSFCWPEIYIPTLLDDPKNIIRDSRRQTLSCNNVAHHGVVNTSFKEETAIPANRLGRVKNNHCQMRDYNQAWKPWNRRLYDLRSCWSTHSSLTG